MIRKWKDYFTDECDTCGQDLTKEGMVYVIRNKQGICGDCYESIKIYLIDVDIHEIHERDCNCKDCVDEIIAGVASMGPEDFE